MRKVCEANPVRLRELDTTLARSRGQRASISIADGLYHINLLDRCKERAETLDMRVEHPRWPRWQRVFMLMIAFGLTLEASQAPAQDEAPQRPRTTLVVFAEKRMQDEAWSMLFDAIRRGLPGAASVAPALDSGVDLLRGDTIMRGLQVEKPISVYLHGDCTLKPVLRAPWMKPLGWVWRVRGQIEPFIHVDCAEIARVLEPLAAGMERERRASVMAEAIARVILHEWVHVATQNAGHTAKGLSKAEFGVTDLLAEDEALKRNRPKFVFAWKAWR
jgi:hypothetical protein